MRDGFQNEIQSIFRKCVISAWWFSNQGSTLISRSSRCVISAWWFSKCDSIRMRKGSIGRCEMKKSAWWKKVRDVLQDFSILVGQELIQSMCVLKRCVAGVHYLDLLELTWIGGLKKNAIRIDGRSDVLMDRRAYKASYRVAFHN